MYFKSQPKPKIWKSKKYREWIKQKRCVFCGKFPPNDPHHLRQIAQTGMGTKPSDSYCVPACRECHEEDQNAKDKNWHNINLERKVIEYLTDYLNEMQKL